MSPEAEVNCQNPECRVATSGKCVEGLAVAQCPHYGKTPVQDQAVTARGDFVSLPSAGRLALLAASSVRRSADTRVVAIVGPTDAGKTSLIASLYDLLQNGRLGVYSFGRSKTFHAFEEACPKARE